ncbi:AraC family transcriptional regulator [Oscillatoria sp. CS-180]|nr:AraC family transcriptional regulator [Oscillatoria sp. CS-180]MDB9527578.1 AraC family transcriptional regulator [Oscillatoria sp. CS-180]
MALQCGFSSQSHMTKHFREATGMTPSRYRKN